MRIAVMGSGAMGGTIGGCLAQAGRDVTFIDRGSHLREMRHSGLRVQSDTGDMRIHPIKATDNPAEIDPVDLVLFCVRAFDVVSAAKSIRPIVGSQTVVLPVQNGIRHIEKLSGTLGSQPVLGGVSLLSAQVTAPGVVQHNPASNSLEFGEMEGGISTRCRRIEQVLAVDGLKATAVPNILERMWWKLAAYSGVGVFCMVRGDKGMVWSEPETKDLYRRAIAEVVAVARAKDISLSDSVPDEHIAILDTFPDQWKPSMLVALEQGYPLELEAIQGALRTIGREVGVPTPINDFVYASLKPFAAGSRRLAHHKRQK